MANRQIVRLRTLVLWLLHCNFLVSAEWKYGNPAKYPNAPAAGPQPNPPYMVDNTNNYYHVAPDKGTQDGPTWPYSGSFDNYMSNLHAGKVMRGGPNTNTTLHSFANVTNNKTTKRQDAPLYWLPNLAGLGDQPLAPDGYKFYRNVVDDYQADASGKTDTSEAIIAAVTDSNRCGKECGNTFTMGAIVYFPPGEYLICQPITQLYYTQFIGDALSPPTIKGCSTFTGIALFDTDPYIPGASGDEWYVNQNQFFRQIRNFVFDLNDMPFSTADNDQPLVPTGIHWQVAQATSLQNLVFNMPTPSDGNTTAVGIFSENGSGGFVSDLTFNGGSIGWRAGSQQYTARNLHFKDCNTAVQMVWDWGWTWQGVDISGGNIAFNISGFGGDSGQGTGSVSIIDSTISDVAVGILTNVEATSPNIVLDNVIFNNVQTAIQPDGDGAEPLLTASGTVGLWATGRQYNGSVGTDATGYATAPPKAAGLLFNNGSLFVQSRPQYEQYAQSSFSVATRDGKCANDGTGDQTQCINIFLQKAVSSDLIAYFPAGIYQVGGTVLIPTGSRVQGSSWSQIQGTGYYFSDMNNPKVVVQVGNKGDVGTMEIVEMLFTVKGNTAGAVLMEWNTAAVTQGAAAMWDSHFRVGGGTGTDLGIDNCPKRGFNDQCIAASLMFHLTPQASGYFENVWAWVADHDNDENMYDNFDKTANQISIYGARGMLIESQGPSWFYGTSSEHSVMYNYQLSGAKNVYMGHIQTETPYFQPNPIAPAPFNVAKSFPNDPDFSSCDGDEACAASWGLRVVDSSSVTIHGAGLYSFFQDYYQDCDDTHDCQQRILEVTGSTGVVIFNLFTVATSDIAVGVDNTVVFQNDSNQRGFTTEDAIWLPIPGADNIDTIFLGTEIWSSTTATCSDPTCLLVFPTKSLPTPVTVTPSSYTTSFEYGGISTVTVGGVVTVTFITTTTTTVLSIPAITLGGMSYSNYNMTSGQSNVVVSPSVNVPAVTIGLPDGSGTTTSRVVPLPPWPDIDGGPTASYTSPEPTNGTTGTSSTYYTGVTSAVTVTGSTVTTITFPPTVQPTTVTCPPDSSIIFNTPAITVLTDCDQSTTWVVGFDCPTTKVVTFLASTEALVSVDCSLVTLWTTSETTTTPPTSTTLPVWTTWPPGIISPVSTTVNDPEPTDSGTKQPCHLWFFFICISQDDLHVGGWFWSFPPGIYGPGPPPSIEWPPGFTLKGTLPPWPRITIGPGGQLTYPEDPEEECETETASVCSTTTTYLITSSDGTVSTTATSTVSDCEPIYGCDVTDSATNSVTSSVTACTVTPTAGARARGVDAKPTRGASGYTSIRRRASDCENVGVIVYPTDPMFVDTIISALEVEEVFYKQIQSTRLGYTAYFWVESLTFEAKLRLQALMDTGDVEYFYDYKNFNTNNPGPQPANLRMGTDLGHDPAASLAGRDDLHEYQSPSEEHPSHNGSVLDDYVVNEGQLWKRAATSKTGQDWNDALVSVPPKAEWKNGRRGGSPAAGVYEYFYDDTAGTGITVYAIGEIGVWTDHPEFADSTPRALEPQTDYGNAGQDNIGTSGHGSCVAASVCGKELGVCKGCSVVFSGHPLPAQAPGSDNDDVRDFYLEDLLSAWDDMNTAPRTPATSVINISWGAPFTFWTPQFIRFLYDILKRMDRAGVTIVVAAGNYGNSPDSGNAGQTLTQINAYPQLFANPDFGGDNALNQRWKDPTDENDLGYLPNMIVVGAVDQYGKKALFSQDADFLTTYAGGKRIYGTTQTAYGDVSGTSFAAPEVAGLAAYLKQLPSNWHGQMNQANSDGPKAVKAMIKALERLIVPKKGLGGAAAGVKAIWNGMDVDTNCLVGFPNGGDPNGVCLDLPNDITTYTCNDAGVVAGPAMVAREKGTLFERQAGPACPIDTDGAVTISFTTGPTVGPTCASSCGGILCTGYWCAPTPTGPPPGFLDPSDPSSSGYTASTTTITSAPTTTPPITSTTPPISSTTSTPPAPTPSNQIVIMYSFGCNDVTCYANYYLYSTAVNTLPDTCDVWGGDDPIYQTKAPETDSDGNYPDPTSLGTFDDGDFKNCEYTGNSDGTGAGSLTCDGFGSPAPCTNFAADSSSCSTCPLAGADEFCLVTYCQW